MPRLPVKSKSAPAELNIEFALVAKNNQVIMAVKRLASAPLESEGARLHILVCDVPANTKSTIEVWNFALPLVQDRDDFLLCTPDGVEPDDIASACRESSWWTDWKALFEATIAADEMLTEKQVADVRLVLDDPEMRE
jgi:hypothetical protein